MLRLLIALLLMIVLCDLIVIRGTIKKAKDQKTFYEERIKQLEFRNRECLVREIIYEDIR